MRLADLGYTPASLFPRDVQVGGAVLVCAPTGHLRVLEVVQAKHGRVQLENGAAYFHPNGNGHLCPRQTGEFQGHAYKLPSHLDAAQINAEYAAWEKAEREWHERRDKEKTLRETARSIANMGDLSNLEDTTLAGLLDTLNGVRQRLASA